MTTIPRVLVMLAAMLLLVASAGSASACPNCKEAIAAQDGDGLEGTPEGNVSDLGKAYSYSVLFMLIMPALIFSCFATAFYRITRPPRPLGTTASSLPQPAYDYSTSTSS